LYITKTIFSSQEEFKAGAVPYHKIRSLQMVVSLVLPVKGEHQDCALEMVLCAICASQHLDLNSLVEASSTDVPAGKRQHALMKVAGKLLFSR
jgi:hypothetical protein